MTTEKMTVHKALCELKTMDSRIAKEISNATFIGTKKACEDTVSGKPVKNFEEDARSKFQKIEDLIRRNDALKRAVSLYNATQKITVDGTEYTISEALYFMNNKQEQRKMLLDAMTKGIQFVDREVEESNGLYLDTRTEQYISSLFGNAKDSQDPEKIKAAENNFRKENKREIVDPLDLRKKADQLQDHIDKFMAELDGALQTANALNEIVIEY